jgi:hypothetical protein
MGGSGWFAKSGKSAFHPTGQSSLVEATPAVRAFIKQYPNGSGSYISRHHPEWQEPPIG